MDIKTMIENDELESALFEAENHPEMAHTVVFDSTLFSQSEVANASNQRDTTYDYRVNACGSCCLFIVGLITCSAAMAKCGYVCSPCCDFEADFEICHGCCTDCVECCTYPCREDDCCLL